MEDSAALHRDKNTFYEVTLEWKPLRYYLTLFPYIPNSMAVARFVEMNRKVNFLLGFQMPSVAQFAHSFIYLPLNHMVHTWSDVMAPPLSGHCCTLIAGFKQQTRLEQYESNGVCIWCIWFPYQNWQSDTRFQDSIKYASIPHIYPTLPSATGNFYGAGTAPPGEQVTPLQLNAVCVCVVAVQAAISIVKKCLKKCRDTDGKTLQINCIHSYGFLTMPNL